MSGDQGFGDFGYRDPSEDEGEPDYEQLDFANDLFTILEEFRCGRCPSCHHEDEPQKFLEITWKAARPPGGRADHDNGLCCPKCKFKVTGQETRDIDRIFKDAILPHAMKVFRKWREERERRRE